MANFDSDVQLTVRIRSTVDQPDANRKLRDLLRGSLHAGIGLLGAPTDDPPPPTHGQIDTLSAAECRPYAQKLARLYLRDLSKAWEVSEADRVSVKPARERPDETVEAP